MIKWLEGRAEGAAMISLEETKTSAPNGILYRGQDPDPPILLYPLHLDRCLCNSDVQVTVC